jgi:hypothetical protein
MENLFPVWDRNKKCGRVKLVKRSKTSSFFANNWISNGNTDTNKHTHTNPTKKPNHTLAELLTYYHPRRSQYILIDWV